MNREESEINAEKRAKNKKLTELNQKVYSEKNVLGRKTFEVINNGKTKIIEETKFKNGTIKRKIVGMKMGARVIWENKPEVK